MVTGRHYGRHESRTASPGLVCLTADGRQRADHAGQTG